MYKKKKRDKVRIKRIVLDLHDVIADSNLEVLSFSLKYWFNSVTI